MFESVPIMKIAFVVQRYGDEAIGGSEVLCKRLAERLSKYFEIEILTTCAKDYVTWKNWYAEGSERIGDVLVRRFRVEKERGLRRFGAITQRVFTTWCRSDEEEAKWVEEQGPYVPQLVHYIRRHESDYDLFVFFTYRYYPTFFGLPWVSEKSILIPTAEDEPTLGLNVWNYLFILPRGVVYLTQEERDLVNTRFRNENCLSDVIGVGVDLMEEQRMNKNHVNEFRSKYKIYGDFILYVGRIDVNKGCDHLFEYFMRYKNERRSDLKLILVGTETTMKIPKHSDIVHVGFSQSDKYGAMKAARLLVMPSEMESFSITTVEALSLGTPVLVNGRCAVLKGHCLRSNAGLYYTCYEEFAACLDLLLSDEILRRKLGQNGIRYVGTNYNWEAIEKKYLNLLDKVFKTEKPFKTGAFTFQGKTYSYFSHPYNTTWNNERAVEIPIIWEIVKKHSGRNILEVGNVLSHYFPVDHEIVDKYEKAHGVINQDVVEFSSPKKYDLIISVSALEHVGWDESPRDPTKVLRAIENLKRHLSPEGEIVITLPLGYNPELDKLLREGKIQFTKRFCLKRTSEGDEWKEVNWDDIRNVKYGEPFPNAANGVVIGVI